MCGFWLLLLVLFTGSRCVLSECEKSCGDVEARCDLCGRVRRTLEASNMSGVVEHFIKSKVQIVSKNESAIEIDVHESSAVDENDNWIGQVSNVFSPLPEALSNRCRRDMAAYLEELRNMTEWAVRMMDASAKLPHGILMGNIRILGDFDECLWVEPPSNMAPQYCLSQITMDVKRIQNRYPKWYTFFQTATYHRSGKERKQLMLGNYPIQKMARIEWGICVPASCRFTEVESILNGAINRILPDVGVRVEVDERDCYRNEPIAPFSRKDWAILSIMLSTILLVVIGTIYDTSDFNNNTVDETPLLGRVLQAFSLKRSWNQLTDFSNARPDQILCIEGMRAISAIWVVFGHHGLLASSSPFVDKITYFNTHKYASMTPFYNFFLAVDTFLLIGGLVRCYTMMSSLERRTTNYLKSALQRYFRLTPALLAVIGLYISVFGRVSNGPYWNRHVTSNVLACEKNWWKTIFYLNNYTKDDYYKCLIQSWYTSLDMQLFLISPLVIIPLWRRPKVGITILCIVATAIVIAQYLTLTIYNLPGLIFTFQTDDSMLHHNLFKYYQPTHTRSLPYIIGIVTGYLIYSTKRMIFSKIQLVVGWAMALAAFAWPLFGTTNIISDEKEYDAWIHLAYGLFHKTVWAMSMSWLIVICYSGYGGIINRILSSNLLKLIGRLSYCIFVSHLGALLVFSGNLRGPRHMNMTIVTKDLISELVLVIAQAIILHLLVEAPFCSLSEIVFKKKKRIATKRE